MKPPNCPECSLELSHVSDNRLHDRYDDFLDECYGTVKIAGYDWLETGPDGYVKMNDIRNPEAEVES